MKKILQELPETYDRDVLIYTVADASVPLQENTVIMILSIVVYMSFSSKRIHFML